MDIIERAKKLVGNWKKFGSFAWHEQPENPENWCIVYTVNRDSDLLTESNARAIDEIMKPFVDDETARAEDHNHWAYGWIRGYSIMVYKDGEIAEAFKAWHGIQERLDNYPVMNEDDWSRREFEATLENVEQVGKRFLKDGAPDTWVSDVERMLSESEEYHNEVESRDGGGGYTSDESVQWAMKELGIFDE